MLVLSRRKNQRLRFPGLGILVEILDIRGAKVSLGVDAPSDVLILRDELEEYSEESRAAKSPADPPKAVQLPREIRHELRNTLHELSLMVHVCRKQTEKVGRKDLQEEEISSDKLFEVIIERLKNLSDHNALNKQGVSLHDPDNKSTSADQIAVEDGSEKDREQMASFLRMFSNQVSSA